MFAPKPLSEIVQTAARAKDCPDSEALWTALEKAGFHFTLAAVHSWWIGRYAPQREAASGLADFFGFDAGDRLALYEARPDYFVKSPGAPRRRKRARAA
jgi:hypothetical protein